jgi:hypothetical protein
MSYLLFFWLLFFLRNLLKNTSHVVGRLTLLEESNELERIRGHRLVCVCELKLMRLGLLFRLWTRQTSTIMQYSTGIYVGISTEKIVVRQS